MTIVEKIENLVVLCCAELDHFELPPLIARITSNNVAVEIFSKADDKPELFAGLVAKHGASALYVFCETESLPPKKINKLKKIAHTGGVPSSSQLIVKFAPEQFDSLSSNIIRQLIKAQETFQPNYLEMASYEQNVEETGSEYQKRNFKLIIIVAAVAILVIIFVALLFALSGDKKKTTSEVAVTPPSHADDSLIESTALEIPDESILETDLEEEQITDTSLKAEKEIVEETEEAGTHDAAAQESAELEETNTGPPPQIISEEVIREAITSRKIRMLDTLLVARLRHKQQNFKKAQKFCESKNIKSIEGWRLPTIGELRSLRIAKMIQRANYWSGTKADTIGEKYFTLEARKGRIVPHITKWSRGKTICVINIEEQNKPEQ